MYAPSNNNLLKLCNLAHLHLYDVKINNFKDNFLQ